MMNRQQLSKEAKAFATTHLRLKPAGPGGMYEHADGTPAKVVGTEDPRDYPSFGIFKSAIEKLDSNPDSVVYFVRPSDQAVKPVRWADVPELYEPREPQTQFHPRAGVNQRLEE